ncbi:MAG: hypothetical protein ACOC56_01680 [Atribacterota bacterium]
MHVLTELERLSNSYSKLDEKMNNIHNELIETKVSLKLKSGVWGLVGGIVPVAILLTIELLRCVG